MLKYESKELENNFINYLLYNSKFYSIANEYITSKDFFHTLPKSIYKCYENHKTPLLLTLFEVAEIINIDFIQLTEMVIKVQLPREIEFRNMCKMIKYYSDVRNYELLKKDADNKLNDGKDLTEIQNDFYTFFNSIENLDETILSSKDLAEQAYNEFMTNQSSQKRYLKTGYSEYDRQHGGLIRNDYVIIAARTSIGKSSFAISLCYNMIKLKYKIAYITLEMTTVSILNKFISIHTGVDLHKVLNPRPNDNIDNEIIRGCEFIRDSNMILEPARGKTEIYIKSKIKKYAALGYEVVIVDLIDKIKCSERKQSRNLEIQHISRALFEASKEYDIAVIAIVQLNREAAKMEKPALHHLKESGDLEQDADVVFLIARPEQTNETVFWDKADATNKARLIKAKDRMGATGYVELGFNKQTTYFYDLDTIDYAKQNLTWENPYINYNEQEPF